MEQCCPFQVWRELRLVWVILEINSTNWGIHLIRISLQIRSCWEMGDLRHWTHSGKAVTLPGTWLSQQCRRELWRKLVCNVTVLTVHKFKEENLASRQLGSLYSSWWSPQGGDGSNAMDMKHIALVKHQVVFDWSSGAMISLKAGTGDLLAESWRNSLGNSNYTRLPFTQSSL